MADATDGRQRRDSVGAEHMLFAVPKKGRLHDKIIQLLKGAGLKWVRVGPFLVRQTRRPPLPRAPSTALTPFTISPANAVCSGITL